MSVPSPPARPAPSPEQIAFCPHCGAAVLIGYRFCEACGASLAGVLAPPRAVVRRGEDETRPAPGPASRGRRGAALALDAGLLLVGFLFAFGAGVQLDDPTVLDLMGLAWLALVGPLYFALYHAFGGPDGGPGATPGEHEVGILVRDARTGERLSLGRAVARAYAGLLGAALVLPLLLELRAGPSWRDRLTGSEVRFAPGAGRAELRLAPTADAVAAEFAARGKPGVGAVGRALALVRRHPREVAGPVLAVSWGLVLLAVLLVPLIVLDVQKHTDEAFASWDAYAVMVLVSGVYWTQAVVVVAVEAVRVGEPRVGVVEIVRRATRRANALTVLLLGVPWALGLLFGVGLLLPPVLLLVMFGLPFVLPRLALVVPAVVLEDRSVLGALRRSWRLTTGRAARVIGLAAASVGLLAVAVPACMSLGAAIGDAFGGSGVGLMAVSVTAGLLVASVPLSGLLACLGTAWCLLYHDARQAHAAGAEVPHGAADR